ncbi:hypothetical protein ACOJVU_17370 [Mycobacterium sp. THU-M104]|uniref:hypothetical protein n=1 Tax=Mycobacterium sp. THU-M104 TaxID=3410515 RepID=UPI003B99E74A
MTVPREPSLGSMFLANNSAVAILPRENAVSVPPRPVEGGARGAGVLRGHPGRRDHVRKRVATAGTQLPPAALGRV